MRIFFETQFRLRSNTAFGSPATHTTLRVCRSGIRGADNWDSPSVSEAIKRYEAVVDNPYNGFQLCLGTVAEGLKNPRADILPVVEYLGRRGKIHQIHMRNIRGGLSDFQEVYPKRAK